ncbi:glycosyltransferase [Parvularcula oceani]|uniref:glycosyltransferase n=1 Tax=Parvularcula oceani TaxID=1247963 RepID=UPI00138E11EA|nr:glycosyltransferase [Parvularcula oceani]
MIWAANTVDAVAKLGLPATLVAGAIDLPFNVSSPEGFRGCRRLLEHFYGVREAFDVMLTYPPPKQVGEQASPASRQWQVEADFARHVLPRAALVHSRDPALNRLCHRHKIPFIYEDHSEDFHVEVERAQDAQLNSEFCRAVIAIAPEVKARLTAMGVDDERILVVESGLSENEVLPAESEFLRWRQFLMQGVYGKLAVYTGGMQEERDIEQIIRAASVHQDVMFAFAGGHPTDIAHWRQMAFQMGVRNTSFLGHLTYSEVATLQQAADLLLYTRKAGPRAFITSPLKLFEYLATGNRIVAAQLPQLADLSSAGLPLTWYDPRQGDFCDRVGEALRLDPPGADERRRSRQFASLYTWRRRQQRILGFAGYQIDSEAHYRPEEAVA